LSEFSFKLFGCISFECFRQNLERDSIISFESEFVSGSAEFDHPNSHFLPFLDPFFIGWHSWNWPLGRNQFKNPILLGGSERILSFLFGFDGQNTSIVLPSQIDCKNFESTFTVSQISPLVRYQKNGAMNVLRFP
jgi:hypothetical protein